MIGAAVIRIDYYNEGRCAISLLHLALLVYTSINQLRHEKKNQSPDRKLMPIYT